MPRLSSVGLAWPVGDRDGRLLPLSVTLLLAAAGIPKVFPNASPRRVVRIGFFALFAGVQNDPAVPADVKSKANTELASGVPFLSDKDLKGALDKAGVPTETADEIVDENATARVDALRSSLSVIAVIALMALYFGGGIPREQPTGAPKPERA